MKIKSLQSCLGFDHSSNIGNFVLRLQINNANKLISVTRPTKSN